MSVATAQIATHSRFKCSKCASKIEKGTGMLLVKADNQKVHVKCAGSVLDKTVNEDEVKDLDKIDPADQTAIKALVAPSAKPAPSSPKKNAAGRPKRAAAAAKKRKADSEDEEEEEEDVSEEPKKKASPKKAAKPAVSPAKASSKRSKKESESEDEEDESASSAEEEKKPKKKAKAPPKPKFSLPADVQAKIDAALDVLADKKADELKDMLRKNDQAFSGLNMAELRAKIADQQVRGKIPRCPKCFGGKLRYEKGLYYCPGYGDDEGRFRRCSFKANDGEITREPWQA